MLVHRFVRSACARLLPTLFASSVLFHCAAPAGDGTSGEASLQESEACVRQRAKLDAAVGRVPSEATYDALVAVHTDACGTTFHTSGPSALESRHLVRIGSNTKTYVAIATLSLVGEGRLALDERLDVHLSDAPAAVAGITVRQLLQHTSGIFNYTATEPFWARFEADPKRVSTPRELVDLALAKPPYFEPGASWAYSNTNYVLLGMLLERVTGQSIATVIRERILTPNHLDETFFEGLEPLRGELTPGFFFAHDESFDPWEDGTNVRDAYDLSWAWSAGAMAATVSDLGRFMELVGSGRLLPPALQAELVTGVATTQPGLRYGLGVFLLDARLTGGAGPAIGHGGDLMGYHSTAFHFPESHLTFAGAVDSDKGRGNDVAAAVLDALFGTQARSSRPAFALPAL